MANKRMYSTKITDSDAFIDLPAATQALYFHICQGADDDGFNNQTRMAMLKAHASAKDLDNLIKSRFIIKFDSGVVVVKHWNIHNTIRKDRKNPTSYQDEFRQLTLKENGSYRLCQSNVSQMSGACQADDGLVECSLVEISLVESSGVEGSPEGREPQKRFSAPTIEEVRAYCQERNNHIDPERFVDYYNSNGWKVGKNPMKDWKAVVRNWERRESQKTAQKKDTSYDSGQFNKKMRDVPVYQQRSEQ